MSPSAGNFASDVEVFQVHYILSLSCGEAGTQTLFQSVVLVTDKTVMCGPYGQAVVVKLFKKWLIS